MAKAVKWPEVLDRWQAKGVQRISVVKFDTSLHYPDLPWLEKATGKYAWLPSNPQTITAMHLADETVTQTEESYAAFCLLCCVTQEARYRLDWLKSLADDVLRRYDPRPGSYWHGTAKHVLPSLSIDHRYWNTDDWRSFTDRAAEFWDRTNKELAIACVPDFMDPHSQEYEDWKQYCRSRSETREQEEYERLKRKYDPPPEKPAPDSDA